MAILKDASNYRTADAINSKSSGVFHFNVFVFGAAFARPERSTAKK